MRKFICLFLFSIFYLLSSIFCFAQDFKYDKKGKRDPFVPLVGPAAGQQVKSAIEVASIEDISLEGIVYDDKGASIAIVNATPLKEGDQIGVGIVEKIEPDKVTFLIDDKSYEVLLSEKKGGK